MKPTEILKEEHRVIERVLAVLEEAATRLERGERISKDLFPKGVEFVRGFADRCHHGKEEGSLFPLLERQGIPREGGPIGVMLFEHEEGRRWVRMMEEAGARYLRGEKGVERDLIQGARGYSQLLRAHIGKEDHVLFPMADQVLSETDQAGLLERFEVVEGEEMGAGVHEHFHHLVEDLEGMIA